MLKNQVCLLRLGADRGNLSFRSKFIAQFNIKSIKSERGRNRGFCPYLASHKPKLLGKSYNTYES